MEEKSHIDHVIKVVCLSCKEENDFVIRLPTAIQCEHCNTIFDARLGLKKGTATSVRDTEAPA